MIQINKDDCVEVGYIQKPHGLKGEVVLAFEKEFEETIEELEFLFIEVDGGLVPFCIEDEGLNFRNDESAICKLAFVDTLSKAKDLVGCKVYAFDRDVIDSEDQGIVSTLVGMRIFDAKFGDIGLISRVDDFSGNLVITVDHPRAEIMIPLSDEVITSVDDEKREMHLNCPNGLIEIYLD
ncbi:MAG TPA: ribosome maturation factor RimM [Prolixibacteraceae bacterium]|jgi:16S rRNA processing protein RimM